MEQYGISFKDSEGNVKDFAGIIDTLNEGLGDLSSADKTKAISQIFGQIPMAGILNLMNAGGDQIREMTESLENCNGTAQEMADIKLDTLMGQWKQFKAEVSASSVEIGEALSPIAKDFVEYLRTKVPDVKNKIIGIAEYLSANSDKVASFASGAFKIGGALMALSAVGKVAGSISSIVGAVGGLSGLLNPVTAAIVGCTAAFGLLYAKSDEFRGNFKSIVSDLGKDFSELTKSFTEFMNTEVSSEGDTIGGFFKNIGTTLGTFGMNFFKNGAEGVKNLVAGDLDLLGGFFSNGLNGLPDFERMKKGIYQMGDAARQIFMPLVDPVSNTVKTRKENVINTEAAKYTDGNGVPESVLKSETITKTIDIQVNTSGAEEYEQQLNHIKDLYSELTNGGTTEIKVDTLEAQQKYADLLSTMQELPEGFDISVAFSGNEEAIANLQEFKNAADEASALGVDISMTSTGGEEILSQTGEITGAVEGVPSSHDTTFSSSGGAAVISEANSVAAAVNSIPSSKTVTISVSRVGDASVNVAENAMGDSFFNGGLTTVAENGYEIINLSKGASIFSHGDSKEILNNYYKNQTAAARAFGEGISGVQLNRGSNTVGANLTFNISGKNSKEITREVAMQLNEVLMSLGA